ncbi:major facilitator superfamily domain-containing protein [Mrakia frigida]|uniref:major facilitator superfamily domain-containing protein n=1 Tax=Mrakia frigida TaxID=29902 RepID=UPI003FCC2063
MPKLSASSRPYSSSEIELGTLPHLSQLQESNQSSFGANVELDDSLPPSSAPSSRSPSPTTTPVRTSHDLQEASTPPSRYSRTPSPSNVVPALPPTDRGREAYLFLFASFLAETLVWGLPFSYAIFQDYYIAGPFPNDEGLVTLTGTLTSGIGFMSGAILFPVLEKKPEWRRPSLYIGFVVMIAGCVGSAFASSAGMLVLTQGILYSTGGSILYAPIISYLHEWFLTRTGFAYGVLTAGTSIAGIVFPFILSAGLQRYGSKGTLWVLGCALFVLVGCLLPFLKGRLPEPSRKIRRERPRHESPNFDYSFVKKKVFWVLFVGNLCQSLGHFLPTIYAAVYASKVNPNSTSLGTVSLALINLTAAISRVVFGILVDANPRFTVPLILLSCFGSGISVFLLWGLAAGTPPGLLVFGTIFGVFSGGFSSLWAGMIRQVGTESPAQAATLFGIFSFGRGLGNVIVAPISTALLSTSPLKNYGLGSFGPLILFSGSTLVVSGFIAGSAGGSWTRTGRRD